MKDRVRTIKLNTVQKLRILEAFPEVFNRFEIYPEYLKITDRGTYEGFPLIDIHLGEKGKEEIYLCGCKDEFGFTDATEREKFLWICKEILRI